MLAELKPSTGLCLLGSVLTPHRLRPPRYRLGRPQSAGAGLWADSPTKRRVGKYGFELLFVKMGPTWFDQSYTLLNH